MKDGKVVVLHVITRLIGGGADENTLHTTDGLSSMDSRYQCLLAAGIESEMDMLGKLNGKVPCFIVPNLYRNISPIRDCLALLSLIQLCRKTQCDILHTHTAKAGILGRIAGKIAGVPVIVHTLHGSTFHPFVPQPARFVFRVMEKVAARFSDKIISVSSLLAESFVSKGIGKKEQYATVYSGMALDRYLNGTAPNPNLLKMLGILPHEKVVGTVCRLEPRKGVTYFLQMAKAVKNIMPACKFVIVGDGRQRAELEKLRDKMGLAKDVIFTGYRRDVPELLALFQVFVLTSLWEGLPRVLVQAGAAEKPLVAFGVDGVREIIKDGHNGYLIQPKNVHQLSGKVLRLLNNPDMAKAMGKRARAMIGRQWTVETMVSEIEKVYQNLLALKFPGRESEFLPDSAHLTESAQRKASGCRS